MAQGHGRRGVAVCSGRRVVKVGGRGEVLVNTKAKGSRAERRAMRILKAAGYAVTRAGGPLGLFDVIAVGSANVRLIQVTAGTTYLSAVERAQISALGGVPANLRREGWRCPDRCRAPLDERVCAMAVAERIPPRGELSEACDA